MKHLITESRRLRVAAIALLLSSVFSFEQITIAQTQNPAPAEKASFSGKYEGTAKGSALESQLTLEVTMDKGKPSGRLLTPQGVVPITEGTITDGKLVLKLGAEGSESTLTAQLQGEELVGEWTAGGQKRQVTLKRVVPVASDAAAVAAATDPSVSLTGLWDGLADAQGQDFPFALTLNVDGEKVTGESSSSLGSSVISNGSYKEGKLVFQLDSQNGSIYMSAVLKDGGLVGEYDYGGQIQGRWVAKKRNP